MSHKIRAIGDIHGKWNKLPRNEEMDKADSIIILGDVGLGFPHCKGITLDPKVQFIRGNHDNPATCRAHPNYLGDYGMDPRGFFYLGGAFSVDWDLRTEGVDLWHNEELSYTELNDVISLYIQQKPRVVLAHTCPESVIDEVLGKLLIGGAHRFPTDRTSKALQAMIDQHQPELFLFGHFHHSWNKTINNTHYRCLNEGERFDFEL